MGRGALAVTHKPLRVTTLLDGNEIFGLPHALGNLLEGIDANRIHADGLFLGPGSGHDLLAARFAASHNLGVGPFFPLRKPGGRKYDPLYLAGRALVLRRCIREAAKHLRKALPAILHTHTPPITWIGWRATRGLPVRRVWHCHGAYPYRGRHSRLFIRFAHKALHGIVAISRFVADTLPPELQDRVHVLHNCVPVERLRREAAPGEFRRQYNIAPDQLLVGIFGAVVPIKGHIYFLEAAARLKQQFPTARFAVVGGTTEAFEKRGALDELSGHVRRLGLDQHVIQTGYLPGATRFMRDFDLIAMPSISTPVQAGEGFGMVLIEAMAQGIAVVSTQCGAPPEIVENGVTGLLVPPRDSAALAEAMGALLSDPARRARIAQAGAAVAAARYDAPVAAARLEAIYADVLNRSAARAREG